MVLTLHLYICFYFCGNPKTVKITVSLEQCGHFLITKIVSYRFKKKHYFCVRCDQQRRNPLWSDCFSALATMWRVRPLEPRRLSHSPVHSALQRPLIVPSAGVQRRGPTTYIHVRQARCLHHQQYPLVPCSRRWPRTVIRQDDWFDLEHHSHKPNFDQIFCDINVHADDEQTASYKLSRTVQLTECLWNQVLDRQTIKIIQIKLAP